MFIHGKIYEDFEISLLYTILRNICGIPEHENGWGDVPLPIDKSVSANIERIRLKRNKYGHSTDISQTHMNLILFYKLPKTTITCKRSFVVNSYKLRDER